MKSFAVRSTSIYLILKYQIIKYKPRSVRRRTLWIIPFCSPTARGGRQYRYVPTIFAFIILYYRKPSQTTDTTDRVMSAESFPRRGRRRTSGNGTFSKKSSQDINMNHCVGLSGSSLRGRLTMFFPPKSKVFVAAHPTRSSPRRTGAPLLYRGRIRRSGTWFPVPHGGCITAVARDVFFRKLVTYLY